MQPPESVHGVEGFLKSFAHHGIVFNKSSDGINWSAYCPFSDKENKLVVNKTTGQWQSYTAGLSGNIYGFLSEWFKFCLENTSLEQLKIISDKRQLPVTVFDGEVAYNPITQSFMFPVKNIKGNIINLSSYRNKRISRTPGLRLGLVGMEQFPATPLNCWICEGEWDFLAWKWALKILDKQRDAAFCIPGANVWKQDWSQLFKDKTVIGVFDKDDAGYKGQDRLATMLRGIARNLLFVTWSEAMPMKYDLSDFIVQNCGAIPSRKKLYHCYEILSSSFDPRTENEKTEQIQIESDGEVIDEIPSLQEVNAAYTKWIQLENTDPISIMFGTCFANRIDGDPVWMFLLAPPGGSKTVLLRTLAKSRYIESVSSLTPSALISGMRPQNGIDPSLLGKIDGKILVVKDFTSILASNPNKRDEIFGILRDAYDGYAEKIFGTGLKKSFEANFGILAGVTAAIDSYASVSASLGERFLRFKLDSWSRGHDNEVIRIQKAMENIDHENRIKEELCDIAKRYLEKSLPERSPEISPKNIQKIVDMAKFVAQLRGVVLKNAYTLELSAMPIQEIGTRLAKELSKLGKGIAVHLNKDFVDDECIRILKKVAVDTCPAIPMSIFKFIYSSVVVSGHSISQSEIVEKTKFSQATISRWMSDLILLGAVIKTQGEKRIKTYYNIPDNFLELIRRSELLPALQSGGSRRRGLRIFLKKSSK